MRRILTGPRRRVLLIGLTLGCAAGCVTACGAPPVQTITILSSTDASVSHGNAPVYDRESGIYEQLVRWWNKYEQPTQHIKIVLDVVPGGATETHAEMVAAAQGGEPFDIYNLDNEWTTEFADSGYILPLAASDFRNPAGFLSKPLRSAEDATGRLYAGPFTTDVGLLFYNKNLVTPAQVGQLHSLSEVIQLARTAMASHQTPEGYAGQFSQYEGLTVNALEAIDGSTPRRPALWPNGTVRDQAILQAGLEQLVSEFSPAGGAAQHAGAVVPRGELVPGYAEPQSIADFAAGHAVFMRNWPISYEQLSRNGEPGSLPARDIGVTALPFQSVLGGQNLAIAASSPNPVGALKVIKFLTSEPAERCLFAVGGFPATRQLAYHGPMPHGYQAVENHSLCGSQPGPSAKTGFESTIVTALRAAVPRPATRYYSEFTGVIQACVGGLLRDAADGHATNAVVAAVANAMTTDLQAASTGRGPTAKCPAP